MIKINNKVIAIYGPTVSNKTGLAVDVAKYIWGKYNIEPELISADSRKAYRDLNVGQSSIWPPYDRKINIHMFKIVNSLEEQFTLYDYKAGAERAVDQIHDRNHFPIIFGGSAVYISSVLENWNVPEDYNPNLDYKNEFGKLKPKYDYIILIPSIEKPLLFKKIKKHFEETFEAGIFEELKKLVKKYQVDPLLYSDDNMLYKTLGYREFLNYCFKNQKKPENLNKRDKEIIKKSIISNSKDFARRQLRWTHKMQGRKYFIENWKKDKQAVDEFLNS